LVVVGQVLQTQGEQMVAIQYLLLSAQQAVAAEEPPAPTTIRVVAAVAAAVQVVLEPLQHQVRQVLLAKAIKAGIIQMELMREVPVAVAVLALQEQITPEEPQESQEAQVLPRLLPVLP